MDLVCLPARFDAEIGREKKMMIQNNYCTIDVYTQILMLYIRFVLRSSCPLANLVDTWSPLYNGQFGVYLACLF
jgi:hypothetical protein